MPQTTLEPPSFFTSPLLEKFNHGFFTRRGGVSKGIFASLDCLASPRSTLHPDAFENLRIAQNALGASEYDLHIIDLQHGTHTHTPDKGSRPKDLPQADALISQHDQTMLAITSADCAPVLIGDPTSLVFCAVHAGWRGTKDQILTQAIHQMQEMGADTNNIRACIGPCIAQKNLKLNKRIQELFVERNKSSCAFFHEEHLDMRGLLEWELKSLGVQHIDHININTYDNKDFFSARRALHKGENVFGAQPSFIGRKICQK